MARAPLRSSFQKRLFVRAHACFGSDKEAKLIQFFDAFGHTTP
jgi:hypothetical protein